MVHTELPIYLTARKLLVLVMGLPKEMRKDAKFIVGPRLLSETIDICRLIRKMNMAPDAERPFYIEAILDKQEFVKDLIEACNETKLITRDQFAEAGPLVESIGKQAGGLRKKYA